MEAKSNRQDSLIVTTNTNGFLSPVLSVYLTGPSAVSAFAHSLSRTDPTVPKLMINLTEKLQQVVGTIALREYLTTYVNLCWVIGQFIAAGILRGMLSVQNEWEYRACYAIQWFWPIPIIPGVFFAPESPWWLVRCGRIEDVGRAIDRLTTKRADTNFNTEQKVAMMIHTNEMEKKVSSGTAFFDCLKHTDLRRTEIVSIVWLMQAFCGSALMGYSTYFYEQAGLPTTQSFNFTLIQYALGAFGTMFS